MSYELRFKQTALKQWKKLAPTIREQFLNILERRLEQPRVPKHQMGSISPNHFKIKLRETGYRLVYQVIDEIVTVEVVAVGRRDKIYKDLEA